MRVALQDFSTGNSLYSGATVTIFTVNPSTFVPTTTLAAVYDTMTGTTMLPNPQTLDGDGKWLVPPYVAVDVVISIQHAAVANHVTGVIGPSQIATGVTTFDIVANPTLGIIWEGSGLAAKAVGSIRTVMQSTTLPEIGLRLSATSNVGGGASVSSAYKITFTATMIAGPASANVYGGNIITGGYAGPGGYLVTSFETDTQNYGVDATNVGASTAAYGLVNVASGTAKITAGVWVYGATAPSGQAFGIAISGNTTVAAVYDTSNAPAIFKAGGGTRVTGLDFLQVTSFGSGYAIITCNNSYVGFLDAGGVPRQMLGLDSANKLQIGGGANAGIIFGNTITPGPDNAFAVGSSSFRFTTIYLATSPVVTSDPATKSDIAPISADYARRFVRAIPAITYKNIIGGQQEYTAFEEQEVDETKDVTENVGNVEVIDGKPVWVVTPITRPQPVYDETAIFHLDGTPAMETVPARAEVRDYFGKIIRPFQPERAVQRIVNIPRKVIKSVEVIKYRGVPGVRTHAGFSADDVKAAIPEGDDIAAYVVSPTGEKGLRIELLLPFVWELAKDTDRQLEAAKREMQAMAAQIATLAAHVAGLKG